MSRSSRRGILGGLAVLAAPTVPALASMAVSPNPDTPLLTACASYIERETTYLAAFQQECEARDAGNKPEAERLHLVQCALAREQDEPLAVIITTPALTLAGRLAKAEVAMRLVQTDLEQRPLSGPDAMIWSLAEDLAGKPLVPPS